jgi:hypothetical protein
MTAYDRSKILRRVVQAIAGLAVGWLVIFVESMLCETAYGGPFTILLSFIMKFFFAGLATGAAFLVGVVLLVPGIRDFWRRLGFWSLLLSLAGVCVIVFASELGLRTVEPVSNYRMMPFWIWSFCLFSIVFPIVNLPFDREPDA